MRKGLWGLGSLDALGPLLVSSVASGVRQQHIMAAVCDHPSHHGQNAEEKKETRAVVFLWPVKAWPGDISESLFTHLLLFLSYIFRQLQDGNQVFKSILRPFQM